MINSTKNINLSAEQVETSSGKTPKINKKKIKKKKGVASEQQTKISCYKDLRTRNITMHDDLDRTMNAFISRVTIRSKSFEAERYMKSTYIVAFPCKKIDYNISPELDAVYKKLGKLYIVMEEVIYKKNSKITVNTEKIEKCIIDLTSIKNEIVKIWNKYNPSTPYEYSCSQANNYIYTRLEDSMLDFLQAQLYNCYNAINDDKNKEIIIAQLSEQKSHKCLGILASEYISIITDYNNLDRLNFKYLLTKYAEVLQSFRKIKRGNANKLSKPNNDNHLYIIASIAKVFLNKNCEECINFKTEELYDTFIKLVGSFSSFYRKVHDYVKAIKQLKQGLSFYYAYFQDPLFQGIHAVLLTENSVVFIEEFFALISRLLRTSTEVANYKKKSQGITNKDSVFKTILDKQHEIQSNAIDAIKQQIKELFIRYNIPTDEIDSWYDFCIKESLKAILSIPADMILKLAKWMDLSKKAKKGREADIKEEYAKINTWLDIIANDHKKLLDDEIEWQDAPIFVLRLFNTYMGSDSVKYIFGTLVIDKQEDLAILIAKMEQAMWPFLGTALLAIAHKDSFDKLLSDLDMLEFIAKQTDRTKYVKSSKYLIAQIITYLIYKNDKLDFTKKQFLFTKAEKLYLELADAGINQAYLLLAETLAALAKTKMFDNVFSEAAELYVKASNYCKILSEVKDLDADLQDLALINMNCFSAEANILGKIVEEQEQLLKELETPKKSAKSKKKSRKKIDSFAKTSEQQELAEEVTTAELVNWHQTYKATASKSQSTKITQAKKTEPVATLARRDEIDDKRNFWLTTKKILYSSTNIEASYTLLVELINNNYFKILESNPKKNAETEKDSWAVLLVYQHIAYCHFLQLKNAQEISNNTKNLRLFYFADGKINVATKTRKVTLENLYEELEQLIRQTIKLACGDIADIETADLRTIVLSLSRDNYSVLPQRYKNQLAGIISTYGHLKSLDDIEQQRKGPFRLAAKLYDKADEVNPNRLIKKQAKLAS